MIGPNQPGNALTDASIRVNAPAQSGVYALYNAQEWVYVGESQNIQNRLQEHMRDARIMGYRPTGFCFELHHAQNRVARQDALILQFDPSANRT